MSEDWIDEAKPVRAGIQMLDGKHINATKEAYVMLPSPSRNERHVVVVEVRRDSIRSTLDGKEGTSEACANEMGQGYFLSRHGMASLCLPAIDI